MISHTHPTALIAEDEPLLREELIQMLARVWPELEVLISVRNGKEAVKQFELLKPDICFLDIHMPALSGVEVARHIGNRSHLVFVTAYDQYAIKAFEHGVLDYLIKPVEEARLHATVERLKNYLSSAIPSRNIENLLTQLSEQLITQQQNVEPPSLESLTWIRAQVGQILKFISVESIDFLRSDDKYTLIGWHNESNQAVEDLIRTPIKELMTQLDTKRFVQVHRAAIVNLNSIKHVVRGDNETATIYLKGHTKTLPVSRTYLHHFRQM